MPLYVIITDILNVTKIVNKHYVKYLASVFVGMVCWDYVAHVLFEFDWGNMEIFLLKTLIHENFCIIEILNGPQSTHTSKNVSIKSFLL